MSFGDLQLLKKLGLGVLSFTGALVAILGFVLLASAFSSPPDELDLPAAAKSLHASRAPSSLVEAATPVYSAAKVSDHVETFAMGCLKNGDRIEYQSSAKLVRFLWKACGSSRLALEASSLFNRANGFEATLFQLEKGLISSDYVSLVGGENMILMELENSAGQRTVAEINVWRRQ
jgi:hypothetical protein